MRILHDMGFGMRFLGLEKPDKVNDSRFRPGAAKKYSWVRNWI